jgi:hypothetical protein
MCKQWFGAVDEQGEHPGFRTEFILQEFEGGEVLNEWTFEIPADGFEWELVEDYDYVATPLLPDNLGDVWKVPDPYSWTGCDFKDIIFTYKLKQLAGGVPVPINDSVAIGDVVVEYNFYNYRAGDPCAGIRAVFPWDPDHGIIGCLRVGEYVEYANPDDEDDSFRVTCMSFSSSVVYVFVERVKLGVVFSAVHVSRRYGERLYLSGSIENIAEADEICVYFSRPGDTGIRNLKSDTSDYLYFKGASGSYDLGANNRYTEFERAGYHWLQIWDVVGNCETPILKRAEWLMNIVLPRYQYQLIFDLEDDDLGDNLYLLEAEYAKYEAAGSWFINHDDPDCFERIQPINTPEDDTPQSGWLSLGVEFGESPCAPIPYYLCPLTTPRTQYWRGECSCDLFKSTLQPLGIPCSHLIAAMNWYSGEPAWSKYIQCP